MDKRYDNVYNLKFVLSELIRKNRFSLEYINDIDIIINILFNVDYKTIGNIDENQTYILRERFGINTLNDILLLTKDEILKIRYIGLVNYNEIKERIHLIGHDFKDNIIDNYKMIK